MGTSAGLKNDALLNGCGRSGNSGAVGEREMNFDFARYRGQRREGVGAEILELVDMDTTNASP